MEKEKKQKEEDKRSYRVKKQEKQPEESSREIPDKKLG